MREINKQSLWSVPASSRPPPSGSGPTREARPRLGSPETQKQEVKRVQLLQRSVLCSTGHLAESLFQREHIRVGFYLTGFVLAERPLPVKTKAMGGRRADLQGFFAPINLPKTEGSQDFSWILSPHVSRWVQIPGAEVW